MTTKVAQRKSFSVYTTDPLYQSIVELQRAYKGLGFTEIIRMSIANTWNDKFGHTVLTDEDEQAIGRAMKEKSIPLYTDPNRSISEQILEQADQLYTDKEIENA